MGCGGFPHRLWVVQWWKVLTPTLLWLNLLLLLLHEIPGGAQCTGCTHCPSQQRLLLLLLLLLKLEEGVDIVGRGG